MIGLSFDDVAISEITLGLFEDSGWYKMNYYTGGLFKFGKNQGCPMLEEKCIQNNSPISKKDYCSKISESLCQTNLMGRGFCYITNSANPDNNNYVYFLDNVKKGGLFIADFCPVIAVPTDKNYFYNWSCQVGKSTYPVEYSERIGSTSACFMSNAVRTNSLSSLQTNSYRATCYSYSCDLISNQLNIYIGNTAVKCPIAGGEMEVNEYLGRVICPDFYSICSYKVACNDIYDCIVKRSEPANRLISYKPTEISGTKTEQLDIVKSVTQPVTNSDTINDLISTEKPLETKDVTDTLVTAPMTKPREENANKDQNNANANDNTDVKTPVVKTADVPKDDGIIKPKVNPIPPPKDLIINSGGYLKFRNLFKEFSIFGFLMIFVFDIFIF